MNSKLPGFFFFGQNDVTVTQIEKKEKLAKAWELLPILGDDAVAPGNTCAYNFAKFEF